MPYATALALAIAGGISLTRADPQWASRRVNPQSDGTLLMYDDTLVYPWTPDAFSIAATDWINVTP